MPATVEGAFVLIDRVSDKLDKIRERAERTDRAMESLGGRMDQLSSNQRVRQLEQTGRAIDNVGRASETAVSRTDRMGQSMRGAERDAGRLKQRLGELGAAVRGLGALMAPGKFAGIGVAIGVAVQAVNALGGGAVALIPRLTDLAGVAGALPATFAGVGLAMGAVKLATSDLSKAMAGNQQALKSLTPEARQFLGTLKAQHAVMQSLRAAAQRGLFPGLDSALRQLHQAVPLAQHLLGGAGAQVGRQANLFAGMLTTPQMLADLRTIGDQGIRILGRIGAGARNVARTIADIAVAAQPFTDWLTKTVLGWTKFVRQTMDARRASGELGAYFARVQRSLDGFFHIAANLYVVMRNIGHAARPLGEDLYGSIEKTTKRWADFTGSLQGQNRLSQYFAQAREPLHALAGLVGDLGKAIVGFNMGGFTATVDALRQAVPSLQSGFQSLATLGPDLARGIGALIRTISDLMSGAGPFALLLRGATNLLTVVDNLIEKIPAFGQLLSAGVVIAGLMRLKGLIGDVAGKWGLVETKAKAAAAEQVTAAAVTSAASGGGGAAGPGMFANWMTNTGLRNTSFAGGTLAERDAARAALAARAAQGLTLGGAARNAIGGSTYGLARDFGYGRGASALAQGGALAGAAGSALMAGARFIGPLALMGGVMGAAQGSNGAGATGLWRNITSAGTFGLVQNQAQVNQAALGRDAADLGHYLGRFGTPTSLAGAQSQIAQLRSGRGVYATQDRAFRDPGTNLDARRRAVIDTINQEIQQRKQLIPELRAERQARRTTSGQTYAQRSGMALAYETRHAGAGVGTRNYVSGVLGQLGGSDPNDPRARIIANSALATVRDAARQNPALEAQYERLRKGVASKFDAMGAHSKVVNNRILTNTQQDWARISRGMTDPLELARQRNNRTWTAMQRDAYNALQLMGLSPGRAQREVTAAEHAGRPVRSAAQIRAADAHARTRNGQNPVLGLAGMAAGLSGPFGFMQGVINPRTGHLAARLRNPLEDLAAPIPVPALRAAARSTGSLVKNAQDAAGKVKQASDDQQKKIVADNQTVQRSTETRWPAIKKAMVDNANGAVREVGSAFDTLQQQATQQLQNMGYNARDIAKLLAPTAGGNRRGATGMRIAGTGLSDTVPVAPGHLAAPGELIVNRHTENRIRQRYGVDLGREVAGETRSHAEPMTYARGGRVMAAHPELHPGIARAVQTVLGRFPGLVVTSTTGGGHAANSYHYRGMAADIGGSTGLMLRAADWIKRGMGRNLTEGIHNPNLSIAQGATVPPSYWGSAVWGEHANHIHLAVAGALGAIAGAGGGGGTALQHALRAGRSHFHGTPGALSNAARQATARGYTRLINRRLAAMGGGDTAGGGMTSAGGTYDKGMLKRLWMRAGGPGGQTANLAAAIALAESGGDPGAHNPSGATGLWQILGSVLPGNLRNPYVNALNAVAKWRAAGGFTPWTTYTGADTPGHVPTYQKYLQTGGRVMEAPNFAGWFRDGGAVTANRPTLIGIGDGGSSETAIIRHGGGARGRVGGRPVHIGHITVQNHRAGDIKEQIKAEVKAAFEELAAELDGLGMEDDAEMLT